MPPPARVPTGLPKTSCPCFAAGRFQSPGQHETPSSAGRIATTSSPATLRVRRHRRKGIGYCGHRTWWRRGSSRKAEHDREGRQARLLGRFGREPTPTRRKLVGPLVAVGYGALARGVLSFLGGYHRGAQGLRPMLGEASAMPPSTREADAAAWLRLQGFEAPTWTFLIHGAAPSHAAGADDGGPAKHAQRLAALRRGCSGEARSGCFIQTLIRHLKRCCCSKALPFCHVLPTGRISPSPATNSGSCSYAVSTYRFRWHRSNAAVKGRWKRCGDHSQRALNPAAQRTDPLERAAACVCQEAGARVAASTALPRDSNIPYLRNIP